MNRSGMTIVELLVSAAILLIILSLVGGGFISSRRGYETNRQVTIAAGQLRAAVEGLQYDLSLAGFCGMQDGCVFVSEPLQVNTTDVDGVRVVTSVTSQYRENRYTGGGEVSVRVMYRVADGKLLRSVAGESEVTLADGISRLVLVGYRNRSQPTAVPQVLRPPAAELSGVVLRLEYSQGAALRTEDFTVPLRNSQVGGAA